MGGKRAHLEAWQSVSQTFVKRLDEASALRRSQVEDVLRLVHQRIRAVEPLLRREEAHMRAAEEALRAKWSGVRVKRGATTSRIDDTALQQPVFSSAGSASTGDLNSFPDDIKRTAKPLRAITRAVAFDAEKARLQALTAAARDRKAAIVREAVDDALRAAGRASADHAQHAADARRLNERLRLPPGIGDALIPGLADVRPGHGPLLLQAGWLASRSFSLEAVRPANGWNTGTELTRAAVPLPDVWVPALVDLEIDGGLVTSDRATIGSLLIRLLALLPAGQLKLQVLDPLRLGDSVKYLFQLNDTAEKVIGEKVASTTTELRELLDGAERHITYVTQKYLGARHKTLHEYNVAAGEVAEPYRVLTLFDYPEGFLRRGSGVDPDLVAQLEKVIGAGPRCGVYTLVHTATADSALTSGPRGLPSVIPHAPSTMWPTRMAPAAQPMQHSTALVPVSTADLVGNVAQGHSHGLVGATSQLQWVPAEPSQGAQRAIDALLVRVERDLQQAGKVEVSPNRVAELAARDRSARISRGLAVGPEVAEPDNAATWWRGTSSAGVLARVGRKGSSSVAEVRLDSTVEFAHLLVGGKPGSGKSVFLHALIGDLTRTYGPEELELYLLDIKFGVEFKAYVSSPHARVVALESGREFGSSVLEALVAKMEARSRRFKDAGVASFEEYRKVAPRPTPRVVAVIDEFHGMFERDDPVGDEAARLLRRLVKQGRALGVHLVLASQTLTGAILLPRDALGLISQRVVFSSSDQDSRLLLADDNPEAVQLDRPGEGIVNLRGGRRDANERIQATLVDRGDAEALTRTLATRAAQTGLKLRPLVFDGISESPVNASVLKVIADSAKELHPVLPIGLPMGIGPVETITLRRAAGGHLLVCAPPRRALPLLALVAAFGLSGRVEVEVVDFDGPGSDVEGAIRPVLKAAGRRARSGALPTLSMVHGPDMLRSIEEAARLARKRLAANDLRSAARIVVVSGLEVANGLRPGSPGGDALATILAEGPAAGVHLALFASRLASVERCLDYGALDHIDVRVVGETSRDESNRLVDDAVASEIVAEQLVIADRARSRPVVVRGFAAPKPGAWGG